MGNFNFKEEQLYSCSKGKKNVCDRTIPDISQKMSGQGDTDVI
jgi:hypothetical protein